MVIQMIIAVVIEVFVAFTTGLGILTIEKYFDGRGKKHGVHRRRAVSHK